MSLDTWLLAFLKHADAGGRVFPERHLAAMIFFSKATGKKQAGK
jgi:hypothetical protein